MAWTTPRTWVSGELVTAALLNTHVRDNLSYLKDVPALNGVQFPATQAASSNVNTLDDYEEGTWTPTIIGTTGAPTSYAVQVGYYTKIGNLVIATFTVTLTAKGTTLTGALGIGGLPFTSQNTTVSDRWCAPLNWVNTTTAYINMIAKVVQNTNTVSIEAITAAATSLAGTSIGLANIADNTGFQATICYNTAT